MREAALELLNRTMDEQLKRSEHPSDFPALPPIPAGRYTDPRFEALEKDGLWNRTWLLAGIASDLPTPGSYRLFQHLDRSVILSHGKDGRIRAFHNACRHRGSPLLLEPQGRAMRFICPYHAWGYDLEGALKSVPSQHDFACLDKAENGLIEVKCETYRGFIFVNFDDDAEPLQDFLGEFVALTEGYPLERMVVKDHFFVEMACNWKIAYHNFLEIYHVNTVHPKTLAPHLDSRSFVIALYEGGHMRFGTRKKGGESLFKTPPVKPDDIAPVFLENTVALPTFPNSFFSLDPVGFNLQCFWPMGSDRSVMEVRQMGWATDSEEDKLYWQGMRTATEHILSEDLCLFENIQQSLRNGTIPSIWAGYQERALYWFEEEIDRRIGPDRVPADLRVQPRIGSFMAPRSA
ncbi:aromatic ring-hydroxylating dioxygenase subunit alpha [Sphingobium rhizovicinum]|uniref:Aromatic ring-hydroxylating dioxygenase subunit alpha n=1 Tax=Sphingobium rhizovicinum TaxID=432308 RepID=A0ABV7NPW8_9SPHN|nr:aromatic ring-hydroxylating dioxygenase subunit alpha [Sphingobium sp. IP1]PHP19080.1 (2Fe-2S)-binding protein [Sphingobium sp. IP1]